MKAETAAILALADTIYPHGREDLIADLHTLIRDKKFLTIEDVAERYQVSPSCVKQWRAAGKITPSLKMAGGTVRFTLADLEKYEELNGRKGGEQQAPDPDKSTRD